MLGIILFGLTAVTGLVDAVSYLGLGQVFTANMTGNVVFLGFAAAGAEGMSLTRSGAALAAFFGGALLGGRLAALMHAGPLHRWAGTAFGAEAALLLAATAAVAGSGLTNDPGRLAVIALTGLAMGVRNATVRKLAIPDMTTTVLTLTITGLAADSRLAGGIGSGWARRAGAVATMFAGAAAGAWLLTCSVTLAFALCGVTSALCAAGAYVGLQHAGEAGDETD